MVEKGQLLFTIDSREYKAAADAAAADASRAEARVALAEQELQARRDADRRARHLAGRARPAPHGSAAGRGGRPGRAREPGASQPGPRLHAHHARRSRAARARPWSSPATSSRRTRPLLTTARVGGSRLRHVHRRRARLPALPGARARSGNRESPRTRATPVLVGLAERGRLPAQGRDGLRRQRAEPRDRHDPRARDAAEPRRPVHAGPVRARAAPRRVADERAPDQRAGRAHRPGPALRLHRRREELGRAPRRHARTPIEGLRVVETGLKAGDKVIINGMRKIFFPGQPVNPHAVPMDQPNLPTPAAGSSRRQADPVMAKHTDFSRIFIDRPILATVLSALILVSGIMAIPSLPISEYPDVVPPSVQVTANYPGANPRTIAETVAGPIEEAVNGVENMIYMKSTSSSDGQMALTVTFKGGTDVDLAAMQVQNRVAQAVPRLPEAVRALGVTTVKASPTLDDGRAPRLAQQDLRRAVPVELREPARARRAGAPARRRPGARVRHRQLRHARLDRPGARCGALALGDATSSPRSASRTSRSRLAASAARRRPRARSLQISINAQGRLELPGGFRRDRAEGGGRPSSRA